MKTCFLTFIFSISFLLCATTQTFAALANFDEDEGVYIVEEKSGDVVYAQHEDDPYIPASTTKMMTVHLLLKNVPDLNQVVTVGPEISIYGSGDSRAGLFQGQQLTYLDLIYALLLPSGNDAAGTIATNVGRQLLGDPNAEWQVAKKRFVDEMNNEAKLLGALRTHFENPQGTYDETHFTTPEDFAKIVKAAVQYDIVKQVCQTPSYQLMNSDGTPNVIYNTDSLITASPYHSDLVTAAKTGTTNEGGRTFVFYSEQNGAEIVGVLFKTEDEAIFTQSKSILDTLNASNRLMAFSDENGKVDTIDLITSDNSDTDKLDLIANKQILRYTSNLDANQYSSEIRYDEDLIIPTDNGIKAAQSIKQGEKVGAYLLKENGTIIKTIPVYAGADITLIPLRNVADEVSKYVGTASMFGIAVLSIILLRNKRMAQRALKFV